MVRKAITGRQQNKTLSGAASRIEAAMKVVNAAGHLIGGVCAGLEALYASIAISLKGYGKVLPRLTTHKRVRIRAGKNG